MIKAYSKFLDILEKLQRAILTVSVPAMVLIMFYQVVMRYVFHNSAKAALSTSMTFLPILQ